MADDRQGSIAWLGRRPGSRRRVFFLTVAILLVLDVGRSLFAHIEYAEPVSTWQPDPARYADIAWPPGVDVAPGAQDGQRLYTQHCAVCHGPDGRGNGPAAPSLHPRPRDFTAGLFKYKSTPGDEAPLESDLLRTVTLGLHASAMPYFSDLLTSEEILTVVRYVQALAKPPQAGAHRAITLARPPARNAADVSQGKLLFQSAGCAGCHGEDGRGGVPMQDAKGDALASRDLTAPWTFRGGSDPEQVWLRVTTGLAGTPMPSFATTLSDTQRWQIVQYVASIARTPPWEPGGKLDGPGQQADLTRRGHYLVHAQICGLCHTTISATGIYHSDGQYLAGGMRVQTYPHGVPVSRNLTSDPQTGLGDRTESQIVEDIRNGRSPGRVLNVFDMPWGYFHSLRDDDAIAIARYLKTLAPVRNQIPAPLRFGFVETIVGKIGRPPPPLSPKVLTFAEQQFGQQRGPSRDWPQTTLVSMQWLVLGLGVLAFFLAPSARSHRASGWRIAGTAAASVLVGIVGYVLYEWPHLDFVPPEQIATGMAAGIPPVSDAPTPEARALAERGRYLFTVASCALCHQNDGRGGLKISWKIMGTLWTRNLTSDPEAGLGKWSDAQIARAIRSGVSRNGYQLHWQAMPWDFASNWDEEDIRAIIAYLRQLPPVRVKVPSDRPPAADDCTTYTFWISESHTPGCGQ
jgi:mono/diheme cytochrome c family protein